MSKPPKIAWLHSHLHNWMGSTRFIFQVITHLKAEIDVVLIVQSADPAILKKFTDAGIEVVNLQGKSTNSVLFWMNLESYCKKDAQKIQQYLDEQEIKKTISSMFPMHYIASKLQGIKNYQYCFEPFAYFWDDSMVRQSSFGMSTILKTLRALYKQKDIEAVSKMTKLFCINKGVQAVIQKAYGREAIPTYMGVKIDFFQPGCSDEIKQRFKDHRILIHSTDYTLAKGDMLAIEIMQKLVPKYPDLKLLITTSIPDDHQKKQLQHKIDAAGMRDWIEILGFVEEHELPQFMSLADIALYPGFTENAGASAASLFVLEAMACGTTVVRCDESEEEVLDGINGLLAKANNSDDFVEKISDLLDNEVKRQSFAAQTRQYIMERYQWKHCAQTLFRSLDL